MKHLKYLAGTSLLSLACIGLFVACGETEGESCVADTDCVAPDVCEGQVCTATCTTDDQCGLGEVCGTRQNGTGTVCVAGGTTNNANVGTTSCADEADPTAFCEAQAGAGAFCDSATGDCVADGPDPVFIVQVADVTTVAEACGDSTDPGSDIQGIELQDSTGNSLGWGNIVAEAVIEDGNNELNYGVINGEPPAIDGDGCVDSFSGNVLALGCTGSIAVEFLDAETNPVALADGQTIFVYEYGGVCSTGTTDDEWTVYSCTDTAAASSADFGSCATVLGSGAGVGSVNVTL